MIRFFHYSAALLVGTVTACPLIAQPKMPPPTPAGSFLHWQARSVSQLVQVTQTDPVARRRFARQFHIPERDVPGYFRRNLLAGSLPKGGDYTVFFVAGSGLVYPTRMDLRPGTPVFVGRDGKPLLMRGTGNPLSAFATAVETRIINGGPTVIVGGTQEQFVTLAPADIPVQTSIPKPAPQSGTQSAQSPSP